MIDIDEIDEIDSALLDKAEEDVADQLEQIQGLYEPAHCRYIIRDGNKAVWARKHSYHLGNGQFGRIDPALQRSLARDMQVEIARLQSERVLSRYNELKQEAISKWL